jgi:TetR/AcrR family transcriptional regulator, mexJK operon transcriptional repressor
MHGHTKRKPKAPGRRSGWASGGRPTLVEASRRQQHLLDVAGIMFSRRGFDGTSIDAVAEAARMSKRTVYARYRDKDALFSAVLRQLIARWLVPIRDFRSSKSELEPMLLEFARHFLHSALAPQAVAIYRIIIAEAERHPEFGRLAHEEGRQPAVRAVAAALARFERELRPHDLELAAEHFISIVVDSRLRLAALGLNDKRSPKARIRAAVDLFLNGVRAAET